MIEDKKNGVKIAKNELEAMWDRVVIAREETIKSLKESLIIEKAFLAKARLERMKAGNKA